MTTNDEKFWKRYSGLDDGGGKERVKWQKWVQNHLISSAIPIETFCILLKKECFR